MKLIKAYIRPMILEDVNSALRKKGFCCMTVFQGEGTDRYGNPEHQHKSLSFPAMHTRVAKIEIATETEDVASITEIIQNHARTRSKGDGIVFVSPIKRAARIRDGKEGADILN